jgi:hypothetical protein
MTEQDRGTNSKSLKSGKIKSNQIKCQNQHPRPFGPMSSHVRRRKAEVGKVGTSTSLLLLFFSA